jgi:hypothetical protein
MGFLEKNLTKGLEVHTLICSSTQKESTKNLASLAGASSFQLEKN